MSIGHVSRLAVRAHLTRTLTFALGNGMEPGELCQQRLAARVGVDDKRGITRAAVLDHALLEGLADDVV